MRVKGRGEARASPPDSPRDRILFRLERETIETDYGRERGYRRERKRERVKYYGNYFRREISRD